jgi:long-chain fatty acid transport protein
MFEPLFRERAPKCGAHSRRIAFTLFAGSVAAGTFLASPREAAASAFAAARFGGEHGNVTTTNPTALYFNPAGIAFSDGIHVYVDGTLAIRNMSWEHPFPPQGEEPDPPDAQGANVGTATLSNVFGGPMLGATMKVGSLAFGLSLSVPFAGRVHWDKESAFVNSPYPLAADGEQRWHGIDGALTFMYLTAGAAYRIGPLAIGATGNLVLSSISQLQAKNPIGDGIPNTAREGRAQLDVSGTQGSFALGAMFEAIKDRLWLGASYQAQPGLGPMTLSGSLVITYGTGTLPTDVEFHQALPDIIRLGARFRPTNVIELRLSGDRTRWSVMQTQCIGQVGHTCAVNADGAGASDLPGGTIQNIRRNWRDTYAIRGGASFWIVPKVEVFGGVGFETAAIPDETLDPMLPDADTIAPALGARVEIIPKFFVAGSYTHIQYFNRDTIGKSQTAMAEPPTQRADGGGIYKQWIGTINANVEMAF